MLRVIMMMVIRKKRVRVIGGLKSNQASGAR